MKSARPISLWTIATTDVLGYILAWLIAFVLACTVALFIYAHVTGEQPRESWTEITIGVTLITAVGYGLLRRRAAKIMDLLTTGVHTRAVVESFRDSAQWVHLTLSYESQGGRFRRTLLLPSSKRTRSLGERRELTVVALPERPRRITVADLYFATPNLGHEELDEE